MQRTTRLDQYDRADLICDVKNHLRENDPAGIGVGKNAKVGWFADPADPSSRDHFRTYMVFEVNAAMRSYRNAINSVHLRLSRTDLGRVGRTSIEPRLKVVYNPTRLPVGTHWYSVTRGIPALFSGDARELAVEESLRVEGNGDFFVNITPLFLQAMDDTNGSVRFVLAITISPEDHPYASLVSGIGVAPPAISGFRIVPKQQLSHQPAIVIDYEDAVPPPPSLVCRDRRCLEALGERCPADCVNGERDSVPPVIEVGVETLCEGQSPRGSFKSVSPYLGLSGFGKTPGAPGLNTGGFITWAQGLSVPCVKWFNTNDYKKGVIPLPVSLWEGGSSIDNPRANQRKIWYRVHDDHRLAKFWIRSEGVPDDSESVSFYDAPVFAYLPNRAQGTLSKAVTLRCGQPTEVTLSAWDFAPNSTHLTVRFEVRGDGRLPTIRPRHHDGHIVRSNYDSVNRRYQFHAGDTLLYDFEIDSADEIQSVIIELDGQTLYEANLESCNPDSTTKIPRHFQTFHDNVPAFSDRNGWRTGASSSAVRHLSIAVTDVEGQTTVKYIPLELKMQSVWSSWDKVDSEDKERILEQEGFFVNWANGPGYLLDGFDWKLVDMKWSEVGEDFLYALKMFFQTYGVTDGIWPATSLLHPAARAWYNNPWHWVLFAVSYPVYSAFLAKSSAWCSGYAMAFQLWRKGVSNWTDFDSCEKRDINGNRCSSSSPPDTYCHINCCRQRDDENKCVDRVSENDVLQYVGAMQGKMFTGEFLGRFVVRSGAAWLEAGGHDVSSAVDDIEHGGEAQGNVGGKIFNKVITMFGGIDSTDNVRMAHSIAPFRSQKLADGVHRVYVYDPNKEQLSYGMKCIDGQYVDPDWQTNCGSFMDNDFYRGSAEPLTKTSGELDPIGGEHRKTLDYILLMKHSFMGEDSEQFHFNEYQGGNDMEGFMFYIEPQYYHGNPFMVEGWLTFFIGVLGTLGEMALDELFDVDFEEIEGYVSKTFAHLHGTLVTAWNWLTNWKSLKSGKDFVLPLPQLAPDFKMYHFLTPSAKRSKLTRKKEGVPYQMTFSAGGADVFLVHGFSGKVGGKDIFELYPGFHRANLALDGVSDPFMVQFTSTIEKERRTATGEIASGARNEMFLATLRISPVDGDQPNVEFEFAEQGETFIIRNLGKTTVEVDLNFLNTFDPYVESGDEEELDAQRDLLDLPNRKRIEKFVLAGSSSVEFSFDTWWNMKEGEVHISQNGSKQAPDGCSCNSVGHQSQDIPLLFLSFIGISLILMRRNKHFNYFLFSIPVVFLIGCFSPPPPEILFRNELVVKFDLKIEGICKRPLFIITESGYETNWNYHFNFQDFTIFGLSGVGYTLTPLNKTDEIGQFPEECILAISHAQSIEEDQGIDNYSADFIPLRIHVKNLCTLEEFHYQGDLPTTDIRVFPECQKMLDGWNDGDSTPENCLKAIPATVTAVYTPETDFDWSQYPQWEQYKDAYNCEDFE